MIKIMIVDDEAIIRKGIKLSINWAEYGVEVVGEAKNGVEALTKISEFEPDIVLTDIRMPVLDGLGLTREIRENYPHIKIVILSGYDDFDYAKQALKLKVEDFLLKPVGSEELIKLFVKLKEQIEVEKSENEAKKQYDQLKPIVQGKLIKRIVTNQCTQEEAETQAQPLDLSIRGPFYQVCLVEIDNYDINEQDKFKIFHDINEMLEEKVGAILGDWQGSQLICLMNLEQQNKKMIIKTYKHVQELIFQEMKDTVTIAFGYVYKAFESIQDSYLEAHSALQEKMYRGENVLLFYQEALNEVTEDVLYSSELNQAFIEALKLTNKQEIRKLVDQLFEEIMEKAVSYTEVKALCIRYLIASEQALLDLGIGKLESEVIDDINKYKTINDMKAWFEDKYYGYIERIEQSKNKKYQYIVKAAMEYVQEHYHVPITLDHISKITYVTPNYFSRIFKEETNQTFVDWMNHYRIVKAKGLLKQDRKAKTAEIAEKVGYNDYKYFSYTFKKYTGKSPREYRKE
ncbi:response regulator [Aquibacillus albus]|uniref:Two-component system response regulator YesN n=1 Tax=Aquibacillus albus TaxID=1168171 RepID=A0ABS2N4E7_9BACI|nr:response regulator [Aquibacillus albus]MBM7572998.1 two-component system response regulator YesN [Aquibacillus albus]